MCIRDRDKLIAFFPIFFFFVFLFILLRSSCAFTIYSSHMPTHVLNKMCLLWTAMLSWCVLRYSVSTWHIQNRHSWNLITILIIYMKKFLHFDWLRAVQFYIFSKQCRKELIQCKKRKQTKHCDWLMMKETHRWPFKYFVFKSSASPGWRKWRRNLSLIAWCACVSSAKPSLNFFMYIISK